MSITLQLRLGDCVEVLKGYSDESIGAIVSDPPYDLISASRNGSPRNNVPDPSSPFSAGAGAGVARGFMGQAWDGTGIAFSARLWDEVYRVLTPGGVVKAFSATRTFHKMGAAMAKVGFVGLRVEAWAYGSGFPKSMSIGKSIDKARGNKNKHLSFFIREHRESGFIPARCC